jgi:hypothetical protein
MTPETLLKILLMHRQILRRTRHESILDEILSSGIAQDHEFPNQISDPR